MREKGEGDRPHASSRGRPTARKLMWATASMLTWATTSMLTWATATVAPTILRSHCSSQFVYRGDAIHCDQGAEIGSPGGRKELGTAVRPLRYCPFVEWGMAFS